ncbi:hypothetical protein EJ02DRAFT_99179 [Clathrospora elynae]|uniref:SGNH hydrolase-type esterase domain-containing protein n=1 Tax=Clathrospora elynae TaxID=706981 RepID=A0A6A5SY89_9PLEO|nr:hypothetical protein EJ02DRAFT_99179 [Clathrospora elynae]
MVKLGALAFGLLTLATQVCAQKTVKIMPFGASIVSRCWRANLQAKLKNAKITNWDFVGSQTGTCGGIGDDQDHEGHPGTLAIDDAKNALLPAWLNTNPPDIMIMLIGTNDVLQKKPTADIIAAYDVLFTQMRAKNANMQIILSNLLPLDPARFPAQAVQGIKDLNTAIASFAPLKSTAKSPVYFVDNFAGFDPVADTDDGEHPLKGSGTEKMAKKFIAVTETAISAVKRAKGIAKRRVGMQERRGSM